MQNYETWQDIFMFTRIYSAKGTNFAAIGGMILSV